MARWERGQSGNPTGRPKRGQAFTDALRGKGTADELAELAWKAARQGAPWAIQMIYNRLEPQTAQVNLTQETNHANAIDCTRLTEDEIEQLESLLKRAATAAPELAGGQGPTPSV